MAGARATAKEGRAQYSPHCIMPTREARSEMGHKVDLKRSFSYVINGVLLHEHLNMFSGPL